MVCGSVEVQVPSTAKETLRMKWAIELTLLINFSVQAFALKYELDILQHRSYTSMISLPNAPSK